MYPVIVFEFWSSISDLRLPMRPRHHYACGARIDAAQRVNVTSPPRALSIVEVLGHLNTSLVRP